MPPRILIVEDDRRSAAALRTRLETHGYVVRIAGDAVEAVAETLSFRPGLILMDLCLPGGSGFSVLEELQDELEPRMPRVIVITASGRPGLRQVALDYGAAGFFLKPYSATDLLRRIAELLPPPPEHDSRLASDGVVGEAGAS